MLKLSQKDLKSYYDHILGMSGKIESLSKEIEDVKKTQIENIELKKKEISKIKLSCRMEETELKK